MPQLRPMLIDDYRAVHALWQSTEGLILSDADSEAAIARYLARNPGVSHVASDGDRIVAAALCGHDGRRGLLHHLAVAPDYRGQGLGRAIVKPCRSKLLEAGISRCNIYVIADHAAGKDFWQHLGFYEWPNIRLMSKDWGGQTHE